MSNGNGNKKIMRGPVWSLILFVCAFTLISVTISAIQGSAGGNVLAAIPLTILYIAAYFVLPRVVRPREQAVQPIENTPLAIPAQLTIIRDNSFAGVAVPTIVTLNGAVAASIPNGGSAMVTLTMRKNILQTNAVGSKNVRIALETTAGANGELHVKGGVFQPKTLRWE